MDRPKIDPHSSTWINIKAWAQGQLQELREENDDDLSEKETAGIRANIKQIKAILEFDSVAETVSVISTHYVD